jgi:hypothetical protein
VGLGSYFTVARITAIKVPDHLENQMQGQSEVLSERFQLEGSGLGPMWRDVAASMTQLVGSVSYDCTYRTLTVSTERLFRRLTSAPILTDKARNGIRDGPST